MRLLATTIFAFLLPAFANGQGVVEGDIFIQTIGGEIRRAAAAKVWLVPLDARWKAGARNLCATTAARRRVIADSLAIELAKAEEKKDLLAIVKLRGRERAELSAVSDSVRAGFERMARMFGTKNTRTTVNAHYRLPGTPAGRFILAASWQYRDEEITWRIPIARSSGGERTVMDLNHTNMDVDGPSSTISVCAPAEEPPR